ncbi:MAG TPA: histidine kinase [Verrucomicrobiales bacterium]|nr:histidine kinase [Verrucomicrobiales bacterium]
MKISGSISEILNRKPTDVWTVGPNDTVFEAIKLMAERNIGAVPVVDGGAVAGILSERDYTRKIVLCGKSSKTTAVSEIMSSPVRTVGPDESIDSCMQIITAKRCRHLPVVRDGKLVGMISIGDLVNWTISAQSAALDQMENYIMGGYAA